MKNLVIIAAMVVALSACSDEKPTQQYTQQQAVAAQQPQPIQQAPVQAAPQPVIINQAPAAPAHSGINTGDVALGALAGFAAGNMMNSGSRNAPVAPSYNQPRTVVVKQYVTNNKTVVNKPPAPSVRSSSRSSFGSFSSSRRK